MFSQESKLAVLESKIGIYEELSREMLSKLEAAVEKISEGNSRIATIIAKHDERIDQSMKNDDLILKMIDVIKLENKEDYNSVVYRIETVEKVVEELKKFRWQFAAIISAALIFAGIIPTIKTMIYPHSMSEEVRK